MAWSQVDIVNNLSPLKSLMALEAWPGGADQLMYGCHTQPTAPIFPPDHMAYRSTWTGLSSAVGWHVMRNSAGCTVESWIAHTQ